MATPYSNEFFVPTTSWRTRKKFCFRKISAVLKVCSAVLCCERTCIKVHVQLEMQIRSVNTASSGTRIWSRPSRTLGDTSNIFIPEEETISELNRYMEFTDVSPLRSPLPCSSKTKKNFSKKEAERNRKQSKFDQGSALLLGEPTALDPQGTVVTTALNGWETWGKRMKSLHLIKSAYNSWHCCQRTWATKNPGCHAKFIKVHDSQGRKLAWEERRVDSPRFTSEVLFKPSRWMQTAKEYYTKDEYGYNRPEKRKTCAFLLMVKSSTCPEYLTCSIREAYHVFKAANPDISMALTKFYSCCKKWVLLAPHQEVCLWVYCANAKLYVSALKRFIGDAYTIEYYERWNNYKNMGAPAT